MDKKLTIILVILAIIVVAIFVFRARVTTQPTQTPTPAQPEVTPEAPAPEVTPTPTPTEQTLPESGANEFLVDGSEFSFNPSEIEVTAGEEVKITLRNVGSIPHDLEVDCPGFETKTRLLNPGEEDTITFTAPESGTCEFYCTVPGHREQGMEGSLIVR